MLPPCSHGAFAESRGRDGRLPPTPNPTQQWLRLEELREPRGTERWFGDESARLLRPSSPLDRAPGFLGRTVSKIVVSRQVLVAIVGIVILTSVIQALAPPGGLAERRRDTARDIPRDVVDI